MERFYSGILPRVTRPRDRVKAFSVSRRGEKVCALGSVMESLFLNSHLPGDKSKEYVRYRGKMQRKFIGLN
jgi:hypothetical protein